MAALKDHETGQHKRHGEKTVRIQPNGGFSKKAGKWRPKYQDLGMGQNPGTPGEHQNSW